MLLVARPHLQYITEVTPLERPAEFARLLAACDGGIDTVQLRERGVAARLMFETAERLLPELERRGVRLVISDRIDVAAAFAGQDVGLHLGAHSLPIPAAQAIASPAFIGVSTHDLTDAVAGATMGASYVTFGHIFTTASHPGEEPAGLGALAQVARTLTVPVLGIGGITAETIPQMLARGAAGATVITAIRDAPDPFAAARVLRVALDTPVPTIQGDLR